MRERGLLELAQYIPITLDHYERVCRVLTHFLVAPHPHHVFTDVERVTEEHDAYFIGEKFGRAGIEAVKLNPRAGRNA